jgi:hypothetical protein
MPLFWALGRKRFFLKKEAKTPARLSRTTRRQPRKNFLVLFFNKEPLPRRFVLPDV